VRIWGVLPIKDLGDAKTRLAPALTPDERRTLFRAMIEDVLSALTSVASFEGVMVVTRDPEATVLAERYGARVLREPENQGQTAAVMAAARTLAAEGVDVLCAVPGDIPLIAADEIEAVLAVHGAAPAVTIVPAWDRRGSNCMICSPPDVIAFSFGNDSFVPHQASARATGASLRIVEQPGIALDVDNPPDLAMLAGRPGPSRAHDYLSASGIAERLRRIAADTNH